MSISLTVRAVSCMWGRGVGGDGYDDVHLHLHTCLMLRNRMFHVGVGVGWGGYDDVSFALAHMFDATQQDVSCGGGGGGGVGMMTFICTSAHMFDATTTGCFNVRCGGGVGVGVGMMTFICTLHTCLMLRNRMFHVGVGWGWGGV